MNTVKPAPAGSAAGVYVVECNELGYFYVGKSGHIPNRLRQHQTGNGAAWVTAHGGFKRAHVPFSPPNDDLDAWERTEVIYRMVEHGFQNVRGWGFSKCQPLVAGQLEAIKLLTLGHFDACNACGREGHFANRCPHPKNKANWLRRIDDRIEELLSESSRGSLLQRAQVLAQDVVKSVFSGTLLFRECHNCGTDISSRSASHKLCYGCYSKRARSTRRCRGRGTDISGDCLKNKFCNECYSSQQSSESGFLRERRACDIGVSPASQQSSGFEEDSSEASSNSNSDDSASSSEE